MAHLPQERILYLKDVVGKVYRVNGLPVDRLVIPFVTTIEHKGLAKIKDLMIAFRDAIGDQKVVFDEAGRFSIDIDVRGVSTRWLAKYKITEKDIVVIDVDEV